MGVQSIGKTRLLAVVGLLFLVGSLVLACAKSSPTPAPTTSTTKASTATTSSSTTTTTKPATTTIKPSSSPSPTADRQAQLEAAAQKEGKIVFWGSTAMDAPKYWAKLLARYPWLKLEVWYGDGTTVAEKVITEARAGVHNVDLVQLSEEVAVQFPKELWTKYEWPNVVGDWRVQVLPGDGLYLRPHLTPLGPVYNSNVIPPAQAPKSWDELKDPKYKGKVRASTSADEALLVLAAVFGQKTGTLDWAAATKFWEEVFRSTGATSTGGYTAATVSLGAGEFGISPYHSAAVSTRNRIEKNLPIDIAPIGTIPAKTSTFSLMKNAQHPNAAKLVADYLSSAEGAREFANVRWSVPLNPGAVDAPSGKYYFDRGFKFFIIPGEFLTAENMRRSADFWRKALGY